MILLAVSVGGSTLVPSNCYPKLVVAACDVIAIVVCLLAAA